MECLASSIKSATYSDTETKMRAGKGRSNLARPVTTLIPSTTDLFTEKPAKMIAANSSYTPALQLLSTGGVVNHQYEIFRILPPAKNLNCYVVRDLTSHPGWCSQCGLSAESGDSDFCTRCGYDLTDNRYLLFEGEKRGLNGVKKLMLANITHEGVLQFFERFHVNQRHYALAQLAGEKKLDDPMEPPTAHTLVNWCLVLGDALALLHKNGFYQPDLSPSGIYLRIDGPKLGNFSALKYISKRNNNHRRMNRARKKDMKAFAKTFLRLIEIFEPANHGWANKEGLISIFKEILTRAIKDEFRTMPALLEELKHMKQFAVSMPVRKKTPALNKPISEDQSGTRMLLGKGSDRGVLRHLNEDSVAIYEYTSIFESVSNPVGLCIVADGMGGHKNGEVASKSAIQTISNKINQAIFSEGLTQNHNGGADAAIRGALETAVFDASDEIHTIARVKRSDMGATVAATLILNDKAYIINVGDSRVYHCNSDGLHLVTEDHSVVYRFFKAGHIEYEEIYSHPQRNQILRCLGESMLQRNLQAMALNANHSYFFVRQLHKGDQLLLCSDGLWEMIPDDRLAAILQQHAHPQDACDELIRVANENGGVDNISVVLVKIL